MDPNPEDAYVITQSALTNTPHPNEPLVDKDSEAVVYEHINALLSTEDFPQESTATAVEHLEQ